MTFLSTCLFSALALLASFAGAAPSRVVVSRKGDCRMNVPSDWKVDVVIRSSAKSRDGAMWAVISSSAPDTGLAFAKHVMEASYKPTRILEDSPRRLIYEYAAGDGKIGLYTGVPGRRGEVCGSQIAFPKAKERLARQIAASVGPTP